MIQVAHGRESRPKPTPDDLRPSVTTCPACHRGMPYLYWQPPSGSEPSQYQPDFTLYCAHLMAFIPGANPGRVCRRCRQANEIVRLFGDADRGIVLDPVRQEIDALRAEVIPPDPAPQGLPPLGRIHVTPGAGACMAQSTPHDGFPARRDGLAREGIERLLLGRFAEGDWGEVGSMDTTLVLASDRAAGVLASPAARNSISVIDSQGSVLATYKIPTYPGVLSMGPLFVWTELTPGQATTLCYAGGDCVRLD